MKFKNLHIVKHPLIQHKLTLVRDEKTSSRDFRALLNEISGLMAFEVTRGIPTQAVSVRTPITVTQGEKVSSKELAVVAILRAGLGMLDGILNLIPNASVGHIGLYRDPETLEAVQYYQKLPKDIGRRLVILVDPMLATGHSAVKAAHILKQTGVKRIILLSLIAAPEGAKAMLKAHPDIQVFTAHLDEKLNGQGYIVPGLGDAGDRLFGTPH